MRSAFKAPAPDSTSTGPSTPDTSTAPSEVTIEASTSFGAFTVTVVSAAPPGMLTTVQPPCDSARTANCCSVRRPSALGAGVHFHGNHVAEVVRSAGFQRHRTVRPDAQPRGGRSVAVDHPLALAVSASQGLRAPGGEDEGGEEIHRGDAEKTEEARRKTRGVALLLRSPRLRGERRFEVRGCSPRQCIEAVSTAEARKLSGETSLCLSPRLLRFLRVSAVKAPLPVTGGIPCQCVEADSTAVTPRPRRETSLCPSPRFLRASASPR